MSASIKYFSILFLCFASFSAVAQKDRKEQLQQRKVQLQDEIELANIILKETKKNEEISLGQMRTLAQKIGMREELIRTIDREMRIINREVKSLQNEIDTLEKTTNALKADYAEMIRQTYKNKNKHNRLLFVLSSEDFTQALKRMSYLKQYADYRAQQVNEIKRKQAELEAKIVKLNERKSEQAKLKSNKEAERNSLVTEKTQQQKVVQDLKSREKEIKGEIKDKQREADKLEKELQRIIAAELRKAREKAEREKLESEAKEVGLVDGKDYTSRTNNKKLLKLINDKRKSLNLKEKDKDEVTGASFALTPEAQKLADNFVANKGKLPWPVERGIVVGKFGIQPHPVVKGIVENNPHIEIATEKEAIARAAFDGEVSSVIRIPGANKVVLVRHGNYFTVYGNLLDVYVKSGDKVTTKQKLGKIYTDKQGKRCCNLAFGKMK